MFRPVCLPLCLCIQAFFLSPLSAQFSGAIQGTVIDETQASVPDAVITARNTETGVVRTVKSSGEGFYRISNLPPGTYALKVKNLVSPR
jgi:hypothetical protein